ncbi:Hypothetical protein NGAL_HAMBI2605_04050 [Neorhizobium galegae bv. orientalis]|nr:Hypothetical protein NGAL_HAMBI2605_04050 [Neorhizobium galegae bv. orientalis]
MKGRAVFSSGTAFAPVFVASRVKPHWKEPPSGPLEPQYCRASRHFPVNPGESHIFQNSVSDNIRIFFTWIRNFKKFPGSLEGYSKAARIIEFQIDLSITAADIQSAVGSISCRQR